MIMRDRNDPYAFISGEHLARIARDEFHATSEELAIIARYTAIRHIVVEDAPDATTVWFRVNQQSFEVGPFMDTVQEAVWVCLQLAKAILTILREHNKLPEDQ